MALLNLPLSLAPSFRGRACVFGPLEVLPGTFGARRSLGETLCGGLSGFELQAQLPPVPRTPSPANKSPHGARPERRFLVAFHTTTRTKQASESDHDMKQGGGVLVVRVRVREEEAAVSVRWMSALANSDYARFRAVRRRRAHTLALHDHDN